MSDVQVVLHENELALRPEELTIEDRFNVRRFRETAEDEIKSIERLSRTIERDGQLDAGIAITNKAGGYTLYAGHRRRRAIILINERRAVAGQSLLRMRVVIDKSGGDTKRKARISNIQRQDLSPMQLATTIREVREENHWVEFPGAKKVADYLGIDTATVTQYERFLTADKHTQDALHSGEMSPGTAFIALTIKPEKVEEVFGKARQKQAEIDGRKKWADDNGAAKGDMTLKLSNGADVPVMKPHEAATQPNKLTAPAILAAIRETPDATTKDVPRTRKEIISFFMELDGPAYGYANGTVREFVDYFVSQWACGRPTGLKTVSPDQMLLKKFDAMVAQADGGTESKRDKEPVEAKTTATGKLKRTDAGQTKPTKKPAGVETTLAKPAKNVTNWNQGPIEDGSSEEGSKKPTSAKKSPKPTTPSKPAKPAKPVKRVTKKPSTPTVSAPKKQKKTA